MLSLEKKLSRIIEDTTGERGVTKFLVKHPEIVRWAFCKTGGHSTYVVKEFQFGSHYKADFVVPMSSSGTWEVHLIELEPPDDKIITQNGTPSKRLNIAIRQINDWKSYIEQNRNSFRQDISDCCRKHDLLGDSDTTQPPRNFTGDRLCDSGTNIWFHYHIVIGRREKVTEEQRKYMNQLSRNDFKICTYGTFLDIARNLDKRELNSLERGLMDTNEDV